MMRLFDTTFLVDLVNTDTGAAKLARTVDDENSVATISAVTAHEYLFGVHFRYGRDSSRLKEKLTSAARDLERFEILPLTREVVEVSSRVHSELALAGQLIGINGIYIAATALNYNLSLVTRNLGHFRRIRGLKLEDY